MASDKRLTKDGREWTHTQAFSLSRYNPHGQALDYAARHGFSVV